MKIIIIHIKFWFLLKILLKFYSVEKHVCRLYTIHFLAWVQVYHSWHLFSMFSLSVVITISSEHLSWSWPPPPHHQHHQYPTEDWGSWRRLIRGWRSWRSLTSMARSTSLCWRRLTWSRMRICCLSWSGTGGTWRRSHWPGPSGSQASCCAGSLWVLSACMSSSSSLLVTKTGALSRRNCDPQTFLEKWYNSLNSQPLQIFLLLFICHDFW